MTIRSRRRDPADEGLDFTRLKRLTGATDGNLGARLDHLARAGGVEATKAFAGRRPRAAVVSRLVV